MPNTRKKMEIKPEESIDPEFERNCIDAEYQLDNGSPPWWLYRETALAIIPEGEKQ